MKNKKIIYISIFAVVVALVVVFYFSKSTVPNEPAAANEVIPTQKAVTVQNDLPKMRIVTVEDKQMLVSSHQGKVVLIMFQPECDNCQREAVQIRDNINAFKDYTLFFISSATKPQIEEFSETYGLSSHDNVIFAQTTIPEVINSLGPISAPSMYIYSAEGRLVKKFEGEVGIEEILPHL